MVFTYFPKLFTISIAIRLSASFKFVLIYWLPFGSPTYPFWISVLSSAAPLHHLPICSPCKNVGSNIISASSLTASGYGISILPEVLIQENPRLVKVPIKGINPISLGIYYKSLQGNHPLKLFVDEARIIFSQEANN